MSIEERQRDELCKTLWCVEGSLRAIAALFEQRNSELCFEQEDLFGLSQLLRKLALEVSIVEDTLRCGRNSRADVSGDII